MSQASSDPPDGPIDAAAVEEAANRLRISGRVTGPNDLLLLDVAAPADPPLDLAGVADALVGLHRQIQDDDDLSDIEEMLEDPLRAGDQRGIDEACDRYRALLASRLKGVLA